MNYLIYVFIALAILLVLLVVFALVYRPLKRKLLTKNYVKIYGRSIYHLAEDLDYYLINNLALSSNDRSKIVIDHVLFGEKYIYVIKDRYYNGGISAKEKDNSWIYYTGKKKNLTKQYIDNPLKINMLRLKKLAQITGIDKSMFISIVLINDDCSFTAFEGHAKDNFIVTRRGFKKLIKSLEQRDVNKINEDQLQYAVKDIAKLNLNRK